MEGDGVREGGREPGRDERKNGVWRQLQALLVVAVDEAKREEEMTLALDDVLLHGYCCCSC